MSLQKRGSESNHRSTLQKFKDTQNKPQTFAIAYFLFVVMTLVGK